MVGLAEVAADAEAAGEAVMACADGEDRGLVGAADALAGAEDEQPPSAIAVSRQAERSHR
jgi:hypothetical protein